MCKPNRLFNPVEKSYFCRPAIRPCHRLRLLVQLQSQPGRHDSHHSLIRVGSVAHAKRSQRIKLCAGGTTHIPQNGQIAVAAALRDNESPSVESDDYGGNYDLEMAIFEFMEKSKNPNSFPTKRQLLEAGRRDLVSAIEAEGGWLTIGWDSEPEDSPDARERQEESYWDVSSNGSTPPPLVLTPPTPAEPPGMRSPPPVMRGVPTPPASKPTSAMRNGTLDQRGADVAPPRPPVQAPPPPPTSPRGGQAGPTSLPRPTTVTGGGRREKDESALSQQGQMSSAMAGYEIEIRNAMRGIGEPRIGRAGAKSESQRGAAAIVEAEVPGLDEERGTTSGSGPPSAERGREEATISGRGVTESPGHRHKLRSAENREDDGGPLAPGEVKNDKWMPSVAAKGTGMDDLEKEIQQKGGWEAVKSLFGLKNTGKIKPLPNPKARTRASRPQAQPGARSKGPGATGSKAETTAPVVDRWEPPRRALDFSARGSSPVSVWRPDTGAASAKSGLTSKEELDATVKRRRKRWKKKASPTATDRRQAKEPPGDTIEDVTLAPRSLPSPLEKDKAEADAPNAGPATLRSRSDLSGMAERIRALETKLAATRTALQSGRESLLQSEQQFKQVRDRTVEELVRVTDSLEFREGEILRTRKELRSTKAQVAALEGKIATDIREAKQMLQDRQNRLAEAQAALKELRSTRVVWSEPAGEVLLAGSFDGWSNRVQMEKSNAGVFVASLQLYPGRYEVKFIVDGSWRVDPRRPIVYSGTNENNVIIIN